MSRSQQRALGEMLRVMPVVVLLLSSQTGVDISLMHAGDALP